MNQIIKKAFISLLLMTSLGIGVCSAETYKINPITKKPDIVRSQSSIHDIGGWTKTGTDVHLTTTSDNVGIGTTDPTSKLHVVGDVNVDGSVTATTYIDTAVIGDMGASGNVGAGITNPIYRLDIRGSGDAIFDMTGNVGIGTTNPSTTLEVIGTATVTSVVETTPTLLLLDQTTPQTIVNDFPQYEDSHAAFTEQHSLVDKEYVDSALVRVGGQYFMLDAADASVAAYKQTSLSASALGTASVAASANAATDTLIEEWISPASMTWDILQAGIYDLNVFAERTAGGRTVRVFWRFYERKADTSEVLIATSNLGDIVTDKAQVDVYATISTDYTPSVNSRLVGKIYFNTTATPANNTTCTLYYQGDEDSNWQIPLSQEFLDGEYVEISGDIMTGGLGVTGNVGVGDTSPQVLFHAGTTPTSGLFVKRSGNIGIGTTAPGSILNTYENTSTTSTGAGVTIEQDGTGDAILHFSLSGDTQWSMGTDNSASDRFKIAASNDLPTSTILVLETGGNVGIGTTAPSAKLEVAGQVKITGGTPGADKVLTSDADGLASWGTAPADDQTLEEVYQAGDNDVTMTAGYGDVRFVNDAAAEMFFLDESSGRVGIGTTGPGSTGPGGMIGSCLDVAENIGIGGGIFHNDENDTYLQFAFDNFTITTGAETFFEISETTQDVVTLGDGGDVDINLNDMMFVDGSSGNVGIGTASPVGLLQVGTAPSASLIVTTDGKVGIGTTGPINSLEVNGIIAPSTNTGGGLGAFGRYWGTSYLYNIQVGGGYLADVDHINGKGNDDFDVYAAAGYNLRLGSNGVTGQVVLNSGNVGIGTTSPSYELDVVGTINASTAIKVNGTDIDSDTSNEFQNLAEVYAQDASTGNAVQLTATNGDIRFYNDAAAEMLFLDESNGRVGIGTTGPDAKLSVVGAASNGIKLYKSDGATLLAVIGPDSTEDGQLILRNSDGNSRVYLNSRSSDSYLYNGLAIGSSYTGIAAPTSGMIIQGNVGIGTTSPVYKLEVNGTLQADDYYSGDASQGIDTTFLDADGNTITVKDGLIVSKVAP